jgi:general secretion pathway protein G
MRGFTLLELLLVLIIVTLLASIVGPIVTSSIIRAKESALKEDLHAMRKAIDGYYSDNGKYPNELSELVAKHYLRKVPVDPLTERYDTWQLIYITNANNSNGISDVHSGSQFQAKDGTYYKEW